MATLGLVALVLLSIVGYSSGIILGAGRREASPSLLDLAWVTFLCVSAVFTRDFLGKYRAFVVWIPIALTSGLLSARIQLASYSPAKYTSFSHLEEWRKVWAIWKGFAAQMGNYQSRVWMALFFFVIVTPFGLILRLFKPPFKPPSRQRSSTWIPRQESPIDLDSARRQF